MQHDDTYVGLVDARSDEVVDVFVSDVFSLRGEHAKHYSLLFICGNAVAVMFCLFYFTTITHCVFPR